MIKYLKTLFKKNNNINIPKYHEPCIEFDCNLYTLHVFRDNRGTLCEYYKHNFDGYDKVYINKKETDFKFEYPERTVIMKLRHLGFKHVLTDVGSYET
jgi:hypothetical protein